MHGDPGPQLLALTCLALSYGKGEWLDTTRCVFPPSCPSFIPESGLLHKAFLLAGGPLLSTLWASLPSVLSYSSLDLEFLFIKRHGDSCLVWFGFIFCFVFLFGLVRSEAQQ